MNTKSTLTIAVAIVIGFSIEPILDRVDFSDPKEKVVEVIYDNRVNIFKVAGALEWKVNDSGGIYAKYGESSFRPANRYSAEVGYQLIKN